MAAPAALVSPEEYLRLEAEAAEKSELRNGKILPVAGASTNHVLISANLHSRLGLTVRKSGCRFLHSDAKVWLSSVNAYYCPDGSVACPPHFVNDAVGAFDNPRVIFEVLSPSSELADRGWKFADYSSLSSLKEYVLIASESPNVQVFRREGENEWHLSVYSGLDRTAQLRSLELELPLRELYEDVEFSPGVR